MDQALDQMLSDYGMIPMPKEERAKFAKAIKDLPVLTADMLKKQMDWLTTVIENFINKYFEPKSVPKYLTGKGKVYKN